MPSLWKFGGLTPILLTQRAIKKIGEDELSTRSAALSYLLHSRPLSHAVIRRVADRYLCRSECGTAGEHIFDVGASGPRFGLRFNPYRNQSNGQIEQRLKAWSWHFWRSLGRICRGERGGGVTQCCLPVHRNAALVEAKTNSARINRFFGGFDYCCGRPGSLWRQDWECAGHVFRAGTLVHASLGYPAMASLVCGHVSVIRDGLLLRTGRARACLALGDAGSSSGGSALAGGVLRSAGLSPFLQFV